jgi:hypothetical protein
MDQRQCLHSLWVSSVIFFRAAISRTSTQLQRGGLRLAVATMNQVFPVIDWSKKRARPAPAAARDKGVGCQNDAELRFGCIRHGVGELLAKLADEDVNDLQLRLAPFDPAGLRGKSFRSAGHSVLGPPRLEGCQSKRRAAEPMFCAHSHDCDRRLPSARTLITVGAALGSGFSGRLDQEGVLPWFCHQLSFLLPSKAPR